jgi:hypothetical protein
MYRQIKPQATRARLLTALNMGMLLLAGCPDNSATGGSGDTGGPMPAEPMDPFHGQGSDPPGNPDPTATWLPPSSLGNGLVYDTRFDIAEQSESYAREVSPGALAVGVDWALVVEPHQTKSKEGFRPTAVDAKVAITGEPDAGMVTLEIADRSAYAADDASNYRHQTLTYAFNAIAAEQTLEQSGSRQGATSEDLRIETATIEAS